MLQRENSECQSELMDDRSVLMGFGVFQAILDSLRCCVGVLVKQVYLWIFKCLIWIRSIGGFGRGCKVAAVTFVGIRGI